jgi:hypothetical protein
MSVAHACAAQLRQTADGAVRGGAGESEDIGAPPVTQSRHRRCTPSIRVLSCSLWSCMCLTLLIDRNPLTPTAEQSRAEASKGRARAQSGGTTRSEHQPRTHPTRTQRGTHDGGAVSVGEVAGVDSVCFAPWTCTQSASQQPSNRTSTQRTARTRKFTRTPYTHRTPSADMSASAATVEAATAAMRQSHRQHTTATAHRPTRSDSQPTSPPGERKQHVRHKKGSDEGNCM